MGSSLPQTAIAPRCPYLPISRVSRAIVTMRRTTRPPLRRCAWCSPTTCQVTATSPIAIAVKIGFSQASAPTDTARAKIRRRCARRSTSQNTGSAASTTGIRNQVK